jgi:glycerol-3-phosphate dehydrogenase
MARDPRPSLAELCQTPYDLLIVGGGINGAGAAREAAGRGLKVLLIEAQDFAFGASSRSTKLVHGGLRYLEQRDFALVGEALKERRILAEVLAPHLVQPLPFLFPVYQGDKRPPWMIRAGLWLYDLLALQGRGLIHWHAWLDKKAALAAMPSLKPEGLLGAAQYWDCRMDDARLVLANVLDAQRLGAKALNYCRLTSAPVLKEGRVLAHLRDEETGQEAEVQAKQLLVCAGPWTDAVFEALGRKSPSPKVKPTKGIHLITQPLGGSQALIVPARSDGRVFFVIPWLLEGQAASLIGTTDGDFQGDPAHVKAEEDEIAYLLQETARVLPGSQLGRKDVLATYAGLRPLTSPPAPLRAGEGGRAANDAISREHRFWEEPGVLAVTGGKYTTYRSLCQSMVERAAKRLGIRLPPSRSASGPLPGAPKDAAGRERLKTLARSLEAEFELGAESAALLVQHYGLVAQDVAQLTREDPALKLPLAPGTASPAILAMAAWSARHEHVLHLADFYLRRSFLGLSLPPDHPGVEQVASVVGTILRWDRQREKEELQLLKRSVAGEYR